MRKRILKAAIFLLLYLFASSAHAEDAKPTGLNVDDIKKALGLSIYLQGGYTYNFKNPDSGENDLRVFGPPVEQLHF